MFGKLGGGAKTPSKDGGEGGPRFGFGRAAAPATPATPVGGGDEALLKEIRNLRDKANSPAANNTPLANA